MNGQDFTGMVCPASSNLGKRILMGHGGGGKLTAQIIENLFYQNFKNPFLLQAHDGAIIPFGDKRIVFTTDSFVVRPLFFPGGDIGKLSVFGTVNDLAMAGSNPLFLSCCLILEEGFLIVDLHKIVNSMKEAAEKTNIQLVAGDTKVVERGKGDGVYINTSGIGICEHPLTICPQSIQDGDVIILSGDIGRHGMAIMSKREGLEFENPLESDCEELYSPVKGLLDSNIRVHCLRDLTRGGLATALVELSATAKKTILVEEKKIPVSSAVLGACEILGLDAHYVANEGRFIAFVPEKEAEEALGVLREIPVTRGAEIIGRVISGKRPSVILKNSLGNERLIDRLVGDQLPRIC